jgi:hypothetical protein
MVVRVIDDKDEVIFSSEEDVSTAKCRKKVAETIAEQLDLANDEVLKKLDELWIERENKQRQHKKKVEEGSPDAATIITGELLDKSPEVLNRPLMLVHNKAYAATWANTIVSVHQVADPDTGEVTTYDPPLQKVEPTLVIVGEDGKIYGPTVVEGCLPLAQLPFEVRLPNPGPPNRIWTGAGVKRFREGKRPNPVELFAQVKEVVTRFIDFDRSLAVQEVMCEMVASYVFATYFLDAFCVIGYVWVGGDKGVGKTSLLAVISEMAYLGQLILATGSYPTLRDLADYGASLAFDDAEKVASNAYDPDKRTLLLAGNRRGTYATVKEQIGDEWVTRYVNTFCPRQFSAIKVPDDVLLSRSIVTPMVRSGDPQRAKATANDPELWPCDPERLRDDLWALGLIALSELREYDRRAAQRSSLMGRDLEPWRAILAVALWLQEVHGVTGLFDRMSTLSLGYQKERDELEVTNPVRVAVKALVRQTAALAEDTSFSFSAGELANWTNRVAKEDDLLDVDRLSTVFTTPSKVGRLLARLRVRKDARKGERRSWVTTRAEVLGLARAYGVEIETVQKTEDAPEDPERNGYHHPDTSTEQSVACDTPLTVEDPLPLESVEDDSW